MITPDARQQRADRLLRQLRYVAWRNHRLNAARGGYRRVATTSREQHAWMAYQQAANQTWPRHQEAEERLAQRDMRRPIGHWRRRLHSLDGRGKEWRL